MKYFIAPLLMLLLSLMAFGGCLYVTVHYSSSFWIVWIITAITFFLVHTLIDIVLRGKRTEWMLNIVLSFLPLFNFILFIMYAIGPVLIEELPEAFNKFHKRRLKI